MSINFDSAFGTEPNALVLWERREEIRANADTPNFKLRDLDFKSIRKQNNTSSVSLEPTHVGRITPRQPPFGSNARYRNYSQILLDGNIRAAPC